MPSRQTGGLGAAGDHHVGIVQLDHPRGVADGVRAGRAGGDHRVVRPLEAVPDRDLAGGQVDQADGMKNGLMRRGPRSRSVTAASRYRRQAADARADQHAGAFVVLVGLGLPAGILDRLDRRRPARRR